MFDIAGGRAAIASEDNEQLEFLGDAVLGFLVSDLLVARRPDYAEGQLSRLKAHLVNAGRLYSVAQRLQLGQYLVLGRSEEMSGGRYKKALLANAVEALLAAIYLDGGIEPCRRFVDAQIIGELKIEQLEKQPVAVDPKSALQELAQARKLPQPRYVIVREQGPEHAKTFTVEARIGREYSAQADGQSKKVAAQAAAQIVLDRLREQPDPSLEYG